MTDPASAGSQQPPASGDYQHAPAAEARWQALRSEIQQDRAAYDKQAASHTLAGRLYLQGRCQGRVAQCEGLLAKMTELEARDV